MSVKEMMKWLDIKRKKVVVGASEGFVDVVVVGLVF